MYLCKDLNKDMYVVCTVLYTTLSVYVRPSVYVLCVCMILFVFNTVGVESSPPLVGDDDEFQWFVSWKWSSTLELL